MKIVFFLFAFLVLVAGAFALNPPGESTGHGVGGSKTKASHGAGTPVHHEHEAGHTSGHGAGTKSHGAKSPSHH